MIYGIRNTVPPMARDSQLDRSTGIAGRLSKSRPNFSIEIAPTVLAGIDS